MYMYVYIFVVQEAQLSKALLCSYLPQLHTPPELDYNVFWKIFIPYAQTLTVDSSVV